MAIRLSNAEKLEFKNRLKDHCLRILQERVVLTKAAMNEAQHSANSEEKSSAGDKYETSRAMSHLEKDMQARQLAEHLKELATLQMVDISMLYEAATSGCFIQCQDTCFFLGAGLGKQAIDGREILFLSQNAPLFRTLQAKKQGDKIIFNGRELTIGDLF